LKQFLSFIQILFLVLIDTTNTQADSLSMSDKIEEAKKKAAYAAVDEYIKDGMIVGVGSGSTVVYVVERLAARVRSENLNILCIPTSFQANQLIAQAGLKKTDLTNHPVIDVTIDGADEVDSELNCIKGGGGCHTQEKIVAACSRLFVVVADYRKDSKTLGLQWKKGVPIEVIPLSYVPLKEKFLQLGAKRADLRMAVNKAGPVVTDNGNFIIDVDFGLITDVSSLNTKLSLIPGVVETGLFPGMAVKAFFGNEDGSVTSRTAPSSK